MYDSFQAKLPLVPDVFALAIQVDLAFLLMVIGKLMMTAGCCNRATGQRKDKRVELVKSVMVQRDYYVLTYILGSVVKVDV